MDETQKPTPTQPNMSQETMQQPPVAPSSMSQEPTQPPKKSNTFATLLVVGAVVLGVTALIMVFWGDKTGTDSASGMDPNQVVATVNGTDIVGADLATSISQITATAQLQGIDTTDPTVQQQIQGQAVDMLINTELLEQEARERGIVITDADVDNRIEALIQEVGSEELLEERMVALGINQETLESDVRSELMIQALLEQVFAEENVTVTDEEVNALYETTTGGDTTAPALEDVRIQVENQIRVSKEQQVVDEFITLLRSDADIEVAQ